jgi:hypothetical protein
MTVAYKDNNEIHLIKLNNFNELLAQGKITPDTIVYNILIDTKSGLDTNWEIPISKSWHSQLVR